MISKSQKERAKKLSPEAREKKDSSAKSLNDIKKSKRKTEKVIPDDFLTVSTFLLLYNAVFMVKMVSPRKTIF